MPNRREFLAALAAPAFAASGWRDILLGYLESLKKPDGAYGWAGDVESHLTPAYFVVGCYHLLGIEPPRKSVLTEWVRANNPLPPRRHTERPLRRFTFEQIQAILWLGGDVSSFGPIVAKWTGPVEFMRAYELHANPVFQQEAHALRCRELLKLPPTTEWRDYILPRRRANGTFNNTPAGDGSDGHVMNTLWGLQAMQALGERIERKPDLIAWLQACQLQDGGFTYAPKPEIAGIDDIAYTWAAVKALALLGAKPVNPKGAVAQVQSLIDPQTGGFRDRAGHQPNPMATFYALETLLLLSSELVFPHAGVSSGPALEPLRPFTMQIEAPGKGSPSEAVEMAKALRIDLWAAKNPNEGWIEKAQQIADERKVQVQFCLGNEEYGTYVNLPGLGTYSHLVDYTAPANTDIGKQMPEMKHPIPWARFRDIRIRSLLNGQGRMMWQFNENEELTRILLDEAVQKGTFAAICTFHFGNENFTSTQPFLRRWEGVLPFVALQDCHSLEPWWSGDQLEGFRTVFFARDAGWSSWLEALRNNRIVSIRQDEITQFEPRFLGGNPQDLAAARAWWNRNRPTLDRPPAVITVVKPGDRFESSVPEKGANVRVRTRRKHTIHGLPLEALTELLRLEIDAAPVEVRLVEIKNPRGRVMDIHYVYNETRSGTHTARAIVRERESGRESAVIADFTL